MLAPIRFISLCVQETIFKNSFVDDGSAFGLRGQRHILRLHVGGEAGILFGGDVGGDKFSYAVDAQLSRTSLLNRHARFAQFADNRAEMQRLAIGERDIAVGDSASDEKCAGFDAVGNHGVFGAVQRRNALNAQSGSLVAFDYRAHFAQQRNEISDFRLARRVFQNGFAIGQRRRHQNIFRAGDGDLFEDDVRTLQTAALGSARFDVAMRGDDFRAHFFERGEVQIDGTRANRAAAGKRNARDAGACERRAQSENRGAHGLHEFVGRDRIADGVGLESVVGGGEFAGGDVHAHVCEQLAHGDDVADLGDIVQRDAVGGQQGSGHRGQRGIFRAADGYRSVKWIAAGDEKFVHESSDWPA